MKTSITLTLALATLLTLTTNAMAIGKDRNNTLNATRIETSEIQESAPALEAWMTTTFDLAASEDSEMLVKLEGWMKDRAIFMESMEPVAEEAVVLENWMTDAPFVMECSQDTLCDYQLALEPWMMKF